MAAAAAYPKSTNPFDAFDDSNLGNNMKEEWEDWEYDSDDGSRPAPHTDGFLVDLSDNNFGSKARKSVHKPAGARLTQHRSVHLPRVKSRARQKAQNAQAGIKLVTDMSQFRQAGATARQQRSADATNKHKFAHTPALQALEGKPSSSSIGSFAWLKRKPGNAGAKKSMVFEDHSSDLSPASRPIVIGISVASDDVGSHQVSPQTAIIETPMDMRPFSHKASGKAPAPQQLPSVWSPDTEASDSPYSGARPISSIYSQYPVFGGLQATSNVPPVPTLPATKSSNQPKAPPELNDEGSSAPCTPFQEDGSPVTTRKQKHLEIVTTSPGSASTRAHGWWDHVTTPFTPQSNNPFKTQPQRTGSSSTLAPHEWWSGSDEKAGSSSKASHLTIITPANQSRGQSHLEKAHVLLDENQSTDAPPPYEYPKTHLDMKVAFSQPYINSQPIPSPGPMTPGLPGTMTSQRGINLSDIPLTPSGVRPVPNAVLPDRPIGSYKTGDHFHSALGRANRVERQRRRHEKEDVMARRVGGFWRGRGCIPEEGCFGRSGREGRKRRRVCLGIFGGVIAAIILIVVLVIVLTHRAMSTTKAHETHSSPGSSDAPEPMYWLNLTDFPPMPTGVFTVTEPNNTKAVSGCFADGTPSTAWSCALPKEDHAHNPLEFIFQVQFDNNTQALWKDTDDTKAPTRRRRKFETDPGFKPDPEPPSLKEMVFLGNTTDKIKSQRKEGEPTPFFISLLESLNKTVGPDVLTRRQDGLLGGGGGNGTNGSNFASTLPDPQLNPDGTGAPVRLFPLPVQQPVRLFDRGLPTEHYGFYTYFDKKIYMVNSTHRDPEDENGGVPIELANSLVTFTQTRFLVQIWTQTGNRTRLLISDDASVDASAEPSSMPYPVTITEDMHGGDQSLKTDFSFGVTSTMEIDRDTSRGITVNLKFQGTLINAADNADLSLGGVDGGTGGCRCEWMNFESLT
ncbi:hypothetical protein EKO27_g1871 [Xylaria grammica]|uniref:Glycoprotease family protein n=1 Tax=Xylaria grammica TaxID=363999 RepID=A0A439DFS4_9PEZI|nr:hypothetical protein EKO27_g1871 [Xylaria grammica]